jgi:hypothetical protein
VWWLLHSLKTGIAQETFERVPCMITYFIGQSLEVLMRPAHLLYLRVNTFLLQRPRMDVRDIPMFYSLLQSGPVSIPRFLTSDTAGPSPSGKGGASAAESTDDIAAKVQTSDDTGHQELQAWLFKLIASGCRTSMDYRMMKKRHAYNLILTTSDSSSSSYSMKYDIAMVMQRYLASLVAALETYSDRMDYGDNSSRQRGDEPGLQKLLPDTSDEFTFVISRVGLLSWVHTVVVQELEEFQAAAARHANLSSAVSSYFDNDVGLEKRYAYIHSLGRILITMAQIFCLLDRLQTDAPDEITEADDVDEDEIMGDGEDNDMEEDGSDEEDAAKDSRTYHSQLPIAQRLPYFWQQCRWASQVLFKLSVAVSNGGGGSSNDKPKVQEIAGDKASAFKDVKERLFACVAHLLLVSHSDGHRLFGQSGMAIQTNSHSHTGVFEAEIRSSMVVGNGRGKLNESLVSSAPRYTSEQLLSLVAHFEGERCFSISLQILEWVCTDPYPIFFHGHAPSSVKAGKQVFTWMLKTVLALLPHSYEDISSPASMGGAVGAAANERFLSEETLALQPCLPSSTSRLLLLFGRWLIHSLEKFPHFVNPAEDKVLLGLISQFILAVYGRQIEANCPTKEVHGRLPTLDCTLVQVVCALASRLPSTNEADTDVAVRNMLQNRAAKNSLGFAWGNADAPESLVLERCAMSLCYDLCRIDPGADSQHSQWHSFVISVASAVRSCSSKMSSLEMEFVKSNILVLSGRTTAASISKASAAAAETPSKKRTKKRTNGKNTPLSSKKPRKET